MFVDKWSIILQKRPWPIRSDRQFSKNDPTHPLNCLYVCACVCVCVSAVKVVRNCTIKAIRVFTLTFICNSNTECCAVLAGALPVPASYSSHLSQSKPSPIRRKQTWLPSHLLVTFRTKDGGVSLNQCNEITSKVEIEWIYWQIPKWTAAEIDSREMSEETHPFWISCKWKVKLNGKKKRFQTWGKIHCELVKFRTQGDGVPTEQCSGLFL